MINALFQDYSEKTGSASLSAMPCALIKQYGFPRFYDVHARNSISDLCRDKFCGIYILSFKDGTFYVGQSVNIARRFLQHKKRFDDIAKITFKRVAKKDLDSAEREMIACLEKCAKLRNINLASLPLVADCEFDELVLPEWQGAWLQSDKPIINDHARVQDQNLRERTAKRCAELLNDSNFQENFLPVMRKYARLCLPEPFRTELTFWGCTCLPTYDKRKIRYSRINLRFQEVFSAYFQTRENKNIYSWHVAKSPFSDSDLARMRQYGNIAIDGHGYPSGDSDQIRIMAFERETAMALLEDSTFLYTAKIFNLARMRSGAQPFAKFHAPVLADALLAGDSDI